MNSIAYAKKQQKLQERLNKITDGLEDPYQKLVAETIACQIGTPMKLVVHDARGASPHQAKVLVDRGPYHKKGYLVSVSGTKRIFVPDPNDLVFFLMDEGRENVTQFLWGNNTVNADYGKAYGWAGVQQRQAIWSGNVLIVRADPKESYKKLLQTDSTSKKEDLLHNYTKQLGLV
jgi:hypothetical protein